ncbi:MAG TPA: lanthionine synthetase C family protein, partial [Thermoanaerobaculia bacterium]|nr:lanthionine synthetase C family protein [Thermoanaerobaculia bacterium]
GLVGIGVYFHERLSRPTARPAAETALRRILVQLMNSVEESDGGLTWHTSPELLPQEVRDSHPQGYYNVGMAHGVPGVIALLGILCEAGFDQSGGLDSDARPLLAGAVDWLLARELPPEAATRFPHLAGPGIAPAPSRLAWCYGDPAIAVALLGAARRSGNTEWERAARRIALDAAARSPEGSRVIDAGLCHGAAGLGHLFHRLHQATGEEALAGAARFWFRQALDLRRPGEGVAGFLAWAPLPNGEEGWDADPGFLTGASGVALALLAALSPIEPAWDRLLMVSIPDQETDVS